VDLTLGDTIAKFGEGLAVPEANVVELEDPVAKLEEPSRPQRRRRRLAWGAARQA
jgi:hypothetical protein